MQWQGRRGSENIEDRRGAGRSGGGKIGLGGVALALVGSLVFGINPMDILQAVSGGAQISAQQAGARDDGMGDFVSVMLADTEEVWAEIFRRDLNRTYKPTTLVLFSGVTRSSCGNASGATGPFYCPADKKVYLDTAFFTTLSEELGATGDAASAYVVAHEVAHHVQDELGILGQVNAVRARSSERESNALSVRVELQADCFSGVWARAAGEAFGAIERGDIEEAMEAASKIGDDTLARNAGQRPMPDSFTHGTSAQRSRWFSTGYESGDPARCDTFSVRNL